MEDIDPRFADTKFVVEANSFEALTLWSQYSLSGGLHYKDEELPRRKWEQDNHGIWYQIGELAGRPVCVSFFWNVIDGVRVMFYDVTSQVSDILIVEEWLKEHCSPTWDHGRRAHCNAMNFHHCLDAIGEINNGKT